MSQKLCLSFQSTLPREERRTQAIFFKEHSDFNPRSHERSDQDCKRIGTAEKDFNPRSHERSDWYDVLDVECHGISIHAPTRGATPLSCGSPLHQFISIHAPTRGATQAVDKDAVIKGISIHAPTRGATIVSILVL